MKGCPKCGLVNPDTGEVCDCGYSFKTRGDCCPRCQDTSGFEVLGLADANARLAAGLIGGQAAKYALYGAPKTELRCKQCGHTFRRTRGGFKLGKWDRVAVIVLLILGLLGFVVVVFLNAH
jgi:hypothetical protein